MLGVRTARRFGYFWKNLGYHTGIFFGHFPPPSPLLPRGVHRSGAMGAPAPPGSVKSVDFRGFSGPNKVLSPIPGKKKYFKPPWTNFSTRPCFHPPPSLKGMFVSFVLAKLGKTKFFCGRLIRDWGLWTVSSNSNGNKTCPLILIFLSHPKLFKIILPFVCWGRGRVIFQKK